MRYMSIHSPQGLKLSVRESAELTAWTQCAIIISRRYRMYRYRYALSERQGTDILRLCGLTASIGEADWLCDALVVGKSNRCLCTVLGGPKGGGDRGPHSTWGVQSPAASAESIVRYRLGIVRQFVKALGFKLTGSE